MASKSDPRAERVVVKRQRRATTADMKLRGEGEVVDRFPNSPSERSGNISAKDSADAVGTVFGSRTRS